MPEAFSSGTRPARPAARRSRRSIVGNLGLILAHRSLSRTVLGSLARRNPALWWIVGLAVVTLVLVLALPGLRNLFHFSEIRFADALVGVGAGLAGILGLDLFDRARRRAGAAAGR